MVKESRATDVENRLIMLAQTGQLRAKVTEEQLIDLLNKLAGMKAETFVDTKTKSGLDKPTLVLGASFDAGKFERVRIGQAGFGFAPDPKGPIKIPQLGRVIIGE